MSFAGLDVVQEKGGYRFSIDPVLLTDFARVRSADTILDLGTGCAIIPLLLSRQSRGKKIFGIEVQPRMADRARRNVDRNRYMDNIEIIESDLRFHRQIFSPQSFDVVLTNPPYRQAESGRQAPNPERAGARHELAGGLKDFLQAAAYCLGDGGRFYIVYLAERIADLLSQMRELRLEPKRLRCVHGRHGDPARMVLVEGRKGAGPGLHVEPPMFVFKENGYSDEVLGIYGERKKAVQPP
ncbi:MAG TPA: tRNA1(Val) (adenine(37)-N6)-methyltransferase [Desulfuromonadales bacterium]|nr:tRNA1(Val) (adenine(37)-N6)-methyltransferase [Desulfuromonadales bacterium]